MTFDVLKSIKKRVKICSKPSAQLPVWIAAFCVVAQSINLMSENEYVFSACSQWHNWDTIQPFWSACFLDMYVLPLHYLLVLFYLMLGPLRFTSSMRDAKLSRRGRLVQHARVWSSVIVAVVTMVQFDQLLSDSGYSWTESVAVLLKLAAWFGLLTTFAFSFRNVSSRDNFVCMIRVMITTNLILEAIKSATIIDLNPSSFWFFYEQFCADYYYYYV